MKNTNIFIASIVLVFTCGLQPLFADTIILKDGARRFGKVVGQTRTQIRIRTLEGKLWVIPKNLIKKLEYNKPGSKAEIEFKKQLAEYKKKAAEKKRLEKNKLKEEANRHQEKTIDKNKNQTAPDTTAWGALWRSALIPGWGQWKRGENNKAGILGAGSLLAGIALYETNRIYQNTARDLNAMNNPLSENAILLTAMGINITPTAAQFFDPVFLVLYNQPFIKQRAKFEKQQNHTRYAKVSLFLIYGWNLIDAYFFHPQNTTNQFGHGSSKRVTQNNWSVYPTVEVDGYTHFTNSQTVGSNVSFRHELHFSKRIEF